MNDFVSFDSFEAMQDYLGKAEVVANSNILPKQREIVYGSHWVRADEGILVYGRVWGQHEVEEGEGKAERASHRDSYERGYRFGTAYSVWCPEGELGSSHISVLWPIHVDEYFAAMSYQWKPTNQPWEREMLARIIEENKADVAARNDSAPSPASPQAPEGDTT